MPTSRGAGDAWASTPRIVAATLVAVLPWLGCDRPVAESTATPTSATTVEQGLSTDQATALGIDFVHVSGRAGQFYLPEITGSGVALFDADGDDDLDLYLVQGGSVDNPGTVSDRLFLNQLAETDALAFVDATETSGIDARGYGMGVAVGDVDNDGHADLYVTNLGPDELWRNRGDGTFERVDGPWSKQDLWSVSATFVDIDGDRHLDLYVVHYLDFSLATHRICPTSRGEDDYCGPVSFRPLPDRLYRNRGDGTFEDVTVAAGIGGLPGSGLGVVASDVDADDDPDLFVANDKMANTLWLNAGNGTFEDAAALWGVGVNRDGVAEAGMGVDAGDMDGDGDDDLFLAHLAGETHTLYRNDGGFFRDVTVAAKIAGPSLSINGFGARYVDLDLDGWLDLVVTGGHVHRIPELVEIGDPFPYHQPSQLLRNQGDGTFEDVTEPLGGDLVLSRVARGLAIGDLDDDGDADVITTAVDSAPLVLLNRTDPDSWIGVTPIEAGRVAIGARVRLLGSEPVQTRRIDRGGSYASSSDPRVSFGITTSPSDIEIVWSDGTTERYADLDPGHYHRLERSSSP